MAVGQIRVDQHHGALRSILKAKRVEIRHIADGWHRFRTVWRACKIERRIVAVFHDTDRAALEFKQKQTLLARHLPIDLTIDKDGLKQLPLTRIYIGPGPAQRVSQVSVGDLLAKFGYRNIPVEISAVPYRVL